MELTLGRAIRSRREELGLTQEELAERIATLGDEAIRQSDISRIERGQVQLPRLPRLEMIAKALETELGSLLIAAGWLSADQMGTEIANQGEPEEATIDTETEPPGFSQVLEAYDRSIRNAYEELAENPGDESRRHELFERRKARFEEMVRRFERVRAEIERKQTR